MGLKVAAVIGIIATFIFMSIMALTVAGGDTYNRTPSSGGLVWSTAKDESDFMLKAEPDKDIDSSAAAVVNDPDNLDGGFSSLDGMLQWAIGHSDPEKLKEKAEDVQRLSPSELKQRQMEIKELLEKMKMPSDAQLMRVAIDDLNNSSLSLEERHRALQELLILVEPIDNANDLGKLGGLGVLIRELNHPDPDIRKISAWILGKASQNNAVVQKQVLDLGALTKLMVMVKSIYIEEAIKAFYAVSALIRNNLAGQEMFYAEAGDKMLQNILSNWSIDIRLRKKAVFLVADLVESQLENAKRPELPLFSDHSFLKSIVDLTASNDLDLKEKALFAIKRLLQLSTTEAMIFKDFCGLESALEKMKQNLQDLMADEDYRDYAMDVENLRIEVELIFHRKIGRVTTVPT